MKRFTLLFLLALLLLPPAVMHAGAIAQEHACCTPGTPDALHLTINCNTTRSELRKMKSECAMNGVHLKVMKKKYKHGKLRVISFKVTAPNGVVTYSTTYIADDDQICVKYGNGMVSAGSCK